MRDFIDLQGVSGTQYRFRHWPRGTPHLPMAGHYVYVQEAARGLTVLAVGESEDLSRLQLEWAAARRRGATHVFTRLNVPRAIREAEQQDLDAAFPDAQRRDANG
jgi:hypothetical protein